eukprot:275075_1
MAEKGTKTGSSIWGASANLFNSVVGVGIVFLPEALFTCGIYLGIIIALVILGLSCYTSMLMVDTAERAGSIDSYGELCQKSMGNFGFYSLTIMTFLMMVGAMSVYTLLFKQLLGQLVSDIIGYTFGFDWAAMLVAAVLIMLPLSLLKDMSKLEVTSGLSTLAVFVIIAIVSIRAPSYREKMVTMDQPTMDVISGGLSKEKANWLCGMVDQDGTPDPFKWAPRIRDMPRATNTTYSDLFHVLRKTSGACTREPTGQISGDSKNVMKVLHSYDAAFRAEVDSIYSEMLFHTWSINDDDAKGKEYSFHQFGKSGFLKALGTFTCAFLTQQCVFSIYLSLKRPTKRNWSSVVYIALFAAFACNMLLAVVGLWYADYHTKGDVFSKMKARFLSPNATVDYATNTARALLILTIALTYPMQMFFGRENFILVAEKLFPNLKNRKNAVFYSVSVGMWIFTVIIGLTNLDMFIVLTLVGAMFAGPILFIMPVVAWYYLVRQKQVDDVKQKTLGDFVWNTALPIFTVVFGILVMVISTIWTLLADVFNVI